MTSSDPGSAPGAAPSGSSGPVQYASTAVLKRALLWDAVLAAAIAVVAGVLGGVFAGGIGVTSALIGCAIALVFLAITAGSIIFANRWAGGELFVGIFFGIVLGGWILKFIVFIVLAILLRHQSWIDPKVLFLSIIAGVIGSLVVDVAVVIRSRIPIMASGIGGEGGAGR